MPIATLSIDIEARLARLEEGLDRAARINQKAAQDVSDRWSNVGQSVKAALAPIAAAFTVDRIRSFVLENAKAVDSLNDIGDATGASIAGISALQDVAVRTGTDIGVVESALIKLNKALSDAKPGSDAEKALKAIGLNAQELKQIDPAEALRRTAVALAGFADDGNKARLVQELFGKSLREVAPLLKDLGEQTELVGSVTKEQAAQAERFVHALGQWESASTRARQAFVGELLPTLTEIVEAFNKTRKGANDVSAAAEAVLVPIQALSILGANVAFVFKGVGTEIGGMAAQLSALGRGDFEGFKAIGKAMKEDAIAARKEFDALEKRILTAGKASKQVADESLKDTRAVPLPSVRPLPEADKNALKRADSVQDAFIRAELEAGDKTNEALRQVTLAKLVQDNLLAAEIALKRFDDVHDAFRRSELESTEQVNAALKKSQQHVQEFSEFQLQARRNLQSGVADTLLAGIEGRFDSIEQLWANLVRRMVAEALAANLNEALFGKGPGGGLIGGLFKTLGFAGTFGDGGFVPPGQWGIAGDRGPEPVFGGSTGVTVVPSGGGVNLGTTVVQIDSRSDRAQVEQLVARGVAAGQRQTLAALKAMGRI